MTPAGVDRVTREARPTTMRYCPAAAGFCSASALTSADLHRSVGGDREHVRDNPEIVCGGCCRTHHAGQGGHGEQSRAEAT